MTTKVLKLNGNIIIHDISTYRGLTNQIYANEIKQQQMREFTELLNEKLGPSTTIDDLTEESGEEVDKSEFKPYQDRITEAYIVQSTTMVATS